MRLIAKRTGFGITAMALLASCTTISPETALAPIETPATWAAISAEESGQAVTLTADWVADLSDPMAAQLISEAIAHNHDLAASAARVRAARERVGITRAGLLPSAFGSLGASRSRSPDGAILRDGQLITLPGGYTNGTSLNLSLSWELDIWGRLTDQTRAAYSSARGARLDFAATQLSIAGATAQSYYGLTEARLQRQLSERDVQTGETNLRIIERRYDRGISSSLDVRLARSSLASSQATLIARQQSEAEASRRLEVLLGRYPSADLNSAIGLPQLAALHSGNVSGHGLSSPGELLFRRPDILATERRLKSAGLNAAAARKALLPSLTLSGGGRSDGTGIPSLFDTNSMVSNIAAGLAQPLFQGGRLRAQARGAKEDVVASAHDYTQKVLVAYREVEDAIAAERYLTALLEARKLAFDEAAAAEELTTRKYLNGTADIFNLINAQQRRISSESGYISAQRTRLTNRIDLYLALGAPFNAPSPFERSYRKMPPPYQTKSALTGTEGDRL